MGYFVKVLKTNHKHAVRNTHKQKTTKNNKTDCQDPAWEPPKTKSVQTMTRGRRVGEGNVGAGGRGGGGGREG